MCGILAYSSKSNNFDITKIRQLLYINSIERGTDATGIYTPINGVKKTLDAGWKVAVDPMLDLIPDTLLIGHVRAATIGNKTDLNNAHPFERGNCRLAHNGTLKNHFPLLRKYGLEISEFNVDSDIIAGCINKSQSLDVLKEIDGAGAFVIADTNNLKRLYIFRNSERPLYRGMIVNNMYISSIPETLMLIGCLNVKEFKPDILYTIEDGEIINTKKYKNNPYKELSEHQLRQAILPMLHCNMRLEYNFKAWDIKEKKRIPLIKGNYYRVTSVVNGKDVTIFDPVSDAEHTVPAKVLNKDDIINNKDFIIMLNDVYSFLKTVKIAKEGEIREVISAYQDGDIAVKELSGAINYTNYFKRFNARKLTDEELEFYLYGGDTGETKISTTLLLPISNKIDHSCELPNNTFNLNEALEQVEDEVLNPIVTEPEKTFDIVEFERSLSTKLTTKEIDNILHPFIQELSKQLDIVKELAKDNNVIIPVKSKIAYMSGLCKILYNKIYPFEVKKDAVK